MDAAAPIAVLGAGSWGTALAILLARNGQTVRLWGHDPKHISVLYHKRVNARYLPNVPFPENLEVSAELPAALAGVQDILIVVPSCAFREVVTHLKPLLSSPVRIAWGTKGLDPQSNKLLHEVVAELLGETTPMAMLSGPSFAKEVALGLPTAATLAYNNAEFAQSLVARFRNPVFRVYTSEDMIGVQVCGAVKNVLAIAVGASDGLGLGANARCALITRGLAEMARLGIALGGKRETFMGLAGVGDLVLTATDDQSRNRRLGLALGAGKSAKEAQKDIGQVIEGATNAKQIYFLKKSLGVDMPISEVVYQALYESLPTPAAVKALLSRDLKEEGI